MGNSYGSYGSLGWPGRSLYSGGYGSGYNSYGGYGGYGGYSGSYGSSYGMYGNSYMNGMGVRDDAESRFIQFAEESSRNTFANVESIVRAFNGIAMMLDNTFFAMTSSFRAVLGVAENFGRLRSMFGHIWHAVNIFRLFSWLHRKLCGMMGVKVPPTTNNLAWNEAVSGITAEAAGSSGSSWPTLAFFGILISAPYFISKLLPKFEDKCDPQKWETNGIKAKAVFDFPATSPNELTLHTNDEITLAPKNVQEEMRLSNSGWAYATCNGRSGVVPLNYIVIVKKVSPSQPVTCTSKSNPTDPVFNKPIYKPQVSAPVTPVSVLSNSNTNSTNNTPRKVQKRVSFGETQIFDTETNQTFSQPIPVNSAKCEDTSNSNLDNAITLPEQETEIVIEESKPETVCKTETVETTVKTKPQVNE